MKEMKTHLLAELFPLMPAAELKSLQDDIAQNGLAHPITLFEGKILDGRHRHEACLNVKVKPRFVEFKGDDPLAFVLSANLRRRHLDTSQRAMVAAKIANLDHGQKKSDKSSSANLPISQAEAAETLAVSTRSVTAAAKVMDESPKLAKQVDAGKISLNAAVNTIAEAKKKETAAEPRKDAVGRTIPEDVIPDWDRAAKVASTLRGCASEIKVTVERGLADKDIVFAEITNPTIAEAASLHYTLSQIAPHAVCPCCQGKLKKNCQLCKRRGFISKYLWNSPAVSAETKALIEKVSKK